MLMAKAMLFIYGDPFKYGIIRPKQGFFTTKLFTEEIIHVGTVQKIREDNIQDYEYVMKDDRFPKTQMPKYWKGEKNIYCAGFSRKGIAGAAQDVMSITEDIKSVLTTKY
ncbi:unnamed protein product [Brassica rapa]|uniref:Flavin-containing monooxygenase n=1 Tax=Brassica campestris TaxID=3711 RepID=A0A8D9G4V4_BRACM|nr:unnamed protein product [Brassica rapa]